MPVFDPDAFMATGVDGGNSTTSLPVPIGEYIAVISDVKKPRAIGDNYGMDITYDIQDAAVKEALGRDKVTVRQTLWLDIDGETGGLDMGKGKNVGLGRLREALNMNSGPFNPNMLNGAGPVRVVVSHAEDKKNPGQYFANVANVARAT